MTLHGHDELFGRVALGVLILLGLYGLGMVVVILEGTSDVLAKSLITGFSGMFGLVVGLASGYLLGTSQPAQAPETAPPGEDG